MTELKIFENPAFGQVRIISDENGEPLFCLLDVCKALGLRAGDVRQRLDEGLVSTQPLKDRNGKTRGTQFINEDGLYDTIFDSRKPIAKQFRKWVTSEVLPTIRKTGSYSVKDNSKTVIKSDRFIEGEKALTALEYSRGMLEGFTALLDSLTENGEKDYADYILLSSMPKSCYQLARDYGMTIHAFFETLHQIGVMKKMRNVSAPGCSYNLEQHVEGNGYTMEWTREFVTVPKGLNLDSRIAWTPKGQLFLYAELRKNGVLPVIDRNKQRIVELVSAMEG